MTLTMRRGHLFIFLLMCTRGVSGVSIMGGMVAPKDMGSPSTQAAPAVAPAPAIDRRSEDPVAVLDAQRAAGEVPVLLLATANKTSAVVGELVYVTWSVIATDADVAMRVALGPLVTEQTYFELDYVGIAEDVRFGDRVLKRRTVRRIAVVASKAGRVHIPESTASLWVWANNSNLQLSAPAIDIDFLPPPSEAAGLPVGHFNLECHRGGHEPYWPSFEVELLGDGTVSHDVAPAFINAPTYPVVMRVSHRAQNGKRSRDEPIVAWQCSLHKPLPPAAVPPLTIRYFDPDLMQVRTSTCDCTKATQVPFNRSEFYREFVKRFSEPAEPPSKPPNYTYPRAASAMAALAGVVMVIIAARS